MSAKRALVVDDSQSARVFLSRILEKYSIEVASVESAEKAIEYLTRHRPPDVIFMDHLMPGMDGLQALSVIKNDPRTATIPVLMYTSQQGELYLGQARALGAVGVLPKQIQQADVTKVLYQLHLLSERRNSEPSSVPATDSAAQAQPGKLDHARPLTDAALQRHFADLRRALTATLDGHASRLEAQLREALPPRSSRPVPEVRFSRRVRWGWIVAAIAGIVAGESLFIAHRDAAQRAALASEVTRLGAALASSSAPGALTGSSRASVQAPPVAEDASSDSRPASAAPIVEVVPYGHSPLGGSRLDVLRQLFDRLSAEDYHGTVDIKVFPGRFCLTGDSTSGYTLAPDDLAYSQCALVGADPRGSVPDAQDYPVGFADLVSSLRAASHGSVDVRVERGAPSSTIVSYPPVTDALTAGAWNRAASANHRIEIRLR